MRPAVARSGPGVDTPVEKSTMAAPDVANGDPPHPHDKPWNPLNELASARGRFAFSSCRWSWRPRVRSGVRAR